MRIRSLGSVLATAALAAGVTAALASPAGAATARGKTSPAPAQVLYGSYNGLSDGDLTDSSAWLPQTQALQAWTGRREGVTNLYAGGLTLATATALPLALTTVWTQARTVPMVSWAVTWSAAENQALADGSKDPALDYFAGQFRQFLAGPDGTYGTSDDRRMYLRPDWEANGAWYPFAPDYGTPSNAVYTANVKTFVAMWQHLVTRLRADGLDRNHVGFVFSVSDTDSWRGRTTGAGAEPIMNDIWPGEQYVDWTGVDGYNMGDQNNVGWRTPAQTFNGMLGRLSKVAPNTPMAVTEVGTVASGAPAGQSKASWIHDYFSWLKSTAATSRLRMSLWFNSTDAKGDYRMFGTGLTGGTSPSTWLGISYQGFSSYTDGVAADKLVGTSDTPRLLTDSQFLGQ